MFSFSNTSDDFNISVNSNVNTRLVSPYLNVNPFLDEPDEYITLGQNGPRRGRFELAFNQIGGLIAIGSIAGAANGLFNGVKQTGHLQGAIRRTQLLNYVMKRSVASSNMLGTLAVMYTGIGVGSNYFRGTEDKYNTILAGTGTGALYMCAGGLRRSAIGGVLGLCVGLGIAAFNATDEDGNKFNPSLYYQ